MLSTVTDLCALRDTVVRLEQTGPVPGATARAVAPERVPLGLEPLDIDAVLGGGLRRGTLHEIVAGSARDEAAAAGFATALAIRFATAAPFVWIVEDRTALETGLPYRPGLASFGLDPGKLVLVRTADTAMALWATEEALRIGTAVVLTELWRPRAYDLAASRRLLLAAQRRGGTSIVLHVGLSRADRLSSTAETRFCVAAAPGRHRPSAAARTPIPEAASFAVRLHKLRGHGSLRGYDREQVHPLLWDGRNRSFRPAASPRSRFVPLPDSLASDVLMGAL
jgi:protein ImuA